MGEQWKAHGNAAFGSGDFEGAADSYAKGLQAEVPRPPWPFNTSLCCVLLSNRSEALLRLARYDEALTDAESALELDGSHAKSVTRQRKAKRGAKAAARVARGDSQLVPPRRSADWLRRTPPVLQRDPLSAGHMAEVSPRLWIGDATAASSFEWLFARRIGAIVNCTVGVPCTFEEGEGARQWEDQASAAVGGTSTSRAADGLGPPVYHLVPVHDKPDAAEAMASHFAPSAAFVAQAHEQGQSVLVHCDDAGRSRCAIIAASFLMQHHKGPSEGQPAVTARATLDQLLSRRWVDPIPAFRAKLDAMEAFLGQLAGATTTTTTTTTTAAANANENGKDAARTGAELQDEAP